MNSFDIAKIAVKAADSKKGQDIQVIGIRDISVLADYFVLVTGESSTQVKAIADEIEYKLGEAGEQPHHKEQRQYFKLEHLWEDGDILDTEKLLED